MIPTRDLALLVAINAITLGFICHYIYWYGDAPLAVGLLASVSVTIGGFAFGYWLAKREDH